MPHERICIFLGKNADGTELFFKLSGIYVHKYGFSLTVEFFNVLWVLVRRHTQDINVVQIGQSFNMNIIASEKNLSCSCEIIQNVLKLCFFLLSFPIKVNCRHDLSCTGTGDEQFW